MYVCKYVNMALLQVHTAYKPAFRKVMTDFLHRSWILFKMMKWRDANAVFWKCVYKSGVYYVPHRGEDVPPEVLRQREAKWLEMLNSWDKWMSKKHKKVSSRIATVSAVCD